MTAKPNLSLFKPVGEVLPFRSGIIELVGDGFTGKTALSLSCPGPVAYLHSAETGRGQLERARRRGIEIHEHNFWREIFSAGLSGSKDEVRKAAGPIFREAVQAFLDSLKWARTLVLDNHPDLYLLSRYAEFGGAKNAPGKTSQLEYEDINACWLSLMSAALAETEKRDFLFVLTCPIEDEWENYVTDEGKKSRRQTGRKTRIRHREVVPQKAHYHIWTHRTMDTDEAGQLTPHFGFRVMKPGYLSQWMGWGQDDNPMLPDGSLIWGLPEILGKITETDEESWRR